MLKCPCKNGGVCVPPNFASLEEVRCTCTSEYQGNRCHVCKLWDQCNVCCAYCFRERSTCREYAVQTYVLGKCRVGELRFKMNNCSQYVLCICSNMLLACCMYNTYHCNLCNGYTVDIRMIGLAVPVCTLSRVYTGLTYIRMYACIRISVINQTSYPIRQYNVIVPFRFGFVSFHL